ncbi:periphilin-1 isoform X1 [Gasterosteus aculeatus]|uniref:Periphilin 1 n=1 Tax=Gasterosteus aculeatus aculeatus TaxID=481459 RepID=A0AAQ4PQT8_GASAC|nr:periphilin-1 isoform X1 [Gasterosteus aculeatus aculeatus]XP_040031430.1 periphilin-1 isoform X1 [Gasterosteus aculeatus aculeatus]
MTYRRERNIREVYEDRFLPERPGPYPRAVGTAERRGPFGRPEDDYGRGGYEYEAGPRFFPNGGGPRNYHEDQRGYHGDNVHFPAERRAVPPSRREEYPYRVPREDPHAGRPLEFGARAPPPHSVRTQGIYPAARSLPESGEDTLVQAILNLDRGEDRDQYRRKAVPFPPLRERSPVRRDAPRSPHSRSGSSVSSRGYSPDRAKTLPFPLQQSKDVDGPEGVSEHHWGALFPLQSGPETLDKIPGLSREGSPHSATSNKEENHPLEGEKEEPLMAPAVEESQKSSPDDNVQERRALAITAKAKEIEKVYRQDCETFGMVVKMLVAKDPNLEKQLQVPLRENLGEIRERCLEELNHFIGELDEVVRQSEPSVCDSTTPSTALTAHKLSKTGVSTGSSY